jgi:hypothetical protein
LLNKLFMLQLNKLRTGLIALAMIVISGFAITACNKQPIGPTQPDPVAPGKFITIAQFRALYSGTAEMAVPAGTDKIHGVVISNSANEAAGNYRIEDESGRGIYLYSMNGSPIYAQGSILTIDASKGGVLLMYNGDLELKNVPIGSVVATTGTMNVTPRITSAQTINDSLQKWSSTLATLKNVVIAKDGAANSTGQNYRITDSTGSILSFVRTASGIVLPEGGATSITGYISIYQPGTAQAVAQLTVRSAADVINGGQAVTPPPVSGITLATSPYLINFDNLTAGSLPAGVSVVTGATATSAGTAGNYSYTSTTSLWNKLTAGFKNFASATGLNMGSDSAAQVNATNRALGVRQTSATGYDPGAAFVFMLNNTTGKNNLVMDFNLQSLDTSSPRTATWAVDYALGDSPTSFTPATVTGTTTTGNKLFTNNAIHVTFPSAVNNQSQKLWIRIVTLTGTAGAGNRPSTAIDDVKFTFN